MQLLASVANLNRKEKNMTLNMVVSSSESQNKLVLLLKWFLTKVFKDFEVRKGLKREVLLHFI